MEDGKNNNSTNNKNTATVKQQHHQQLYLLQQYQQQQQQQSQQAISRFPSNIDAHLRTPGLRSLHNPQAQQQQQINSSLQQAIAAQHLHPTPQQQMKVRSAQPLPLEVNMALQDAFKVCNPEIKRPFASLEDAFNSLHSSRAPTISDGGHIWRGALIVGDGGHIRRGAPIVGNGGYIRRETFIVGDDSHIRRWTPIVGDGGHIWRGELEFGKEAAKIDGGGHIWYGHTFGEGSLHSVRGAHICR